MDLSVGTRFFINNSLFHHKEVIVIKDDTDENRCDKCLFKVFEEECFCFRCFHKHRKDGMSVHFEKVKE